MSFRGTVGACTVYQRSDCSVQSWLELCMSYTFCCVYATISLFRTLNHHLSTILLSPLLSHSPQTSVTSSDHQNPKKQTGKSLSLTFKAKDSPDIPWISWLKAFRFPLSQQLIIGSNLSLSLSFFKDEFRSYLFQEALTGIPGQRTSLSSEC